MEKKERERETGEEKERKGIESLNGSAERKEPLETTVGGKKMAFIQREPAEANQMKHARKVYTQRRGGGEKKIALGE